MPDSLAGQSPGELLREARVARDMTLEEVAGITKVAESMLSALEQDKYHRISGPLYVKSFIRAYAEAVGLDPHEIVSLYDQQQRQPLGGVDGDRQVWTESDVEVRRVGVPGRTLIWRWALVAAVALGVSWLAWQKLDRGDGDVGVDGAAPATSVSLPAASAPGTELDVPAVAAGDTGVAAAADSVALGTVERDSLAPDWVTAPPGARAPH